MFDTMTITKAGGALCGALLVFLLGNWAAESLYHVGTAGHGDEEHAAGYVIEVEASGGEAKEEVVVDVAAILAAGDVASGAKVFSKCKACHKLEKGANATGPYLYGVVGRAVDAAEGYGYSGALEQAADVWTPENLYVFLEDPRGYAPGNKMSFSGLKKPEDRAHLIAYLDSLDN